MAAPVGRGPRDRRAVSVAWMCHPGSYSMCWSETSCVALRCCRIIPSIRYPEDRCVERRVLVEILLPAGGWWWLLFLVRLTSVLRHSVRGRPRRRCFWRGRFVAAALTFRIMPGGSTPDPL